jgi:CheY-like chemotaxis protein
MYMNKHNYTHSTARDGFEALEAYRAAASSPFRTIFMGTHLFPLLTNLHSLQSAILFVMLTPFTDISMPRMDGLQSTRHIRAFERENNIAPATIIMLTGLGSASVQQEAHSSGADLLLTKPVRLKELGKILNELKDKEMSR